MVKKAIIIYIIIGSVNVYEVSVLGTAVKLVNMSAILLMVVVLLLNLIYGKKNSTEKHFKLPIIFIGIAVFASMFMAFAAFNQSFAISIYNQRDIYFYLVYFTLHALNIEKREMQRLIAYFGLLYFCIYLLQFFAYPTEFLNVAMRDSRGTIRIYMQGGGYAMISYFMCMQIFYTENKLKYLLLALVFFIPVILFGSRSVAATLLGATVVQLLLTKRVKSKMLITLLVLVTMVTTIYFLQDVFAGVLMAQKKESAEGSNNIRLLASAYFLNHLLPNDLSYFTGVGSPSERSPLGQITLLLREKYGFYLSDVGVVGNYVMYGPLFVFSILWLVLKVLFSKISEDLFFLKVFFFFEVLLMLPIAGGFAFSPDIAFICIMIYLVDISIHERKRKDKMSDIPIMKNVNQL